MNSQPVKQPVEPVIEQWRRSLRRLARIRALGRWVAGIATACCIGVFFSPSHTFVSILLLQVAASSWILANGADSQIRVLETLRASHGLRGERATPSV